MTQDVLRDLGHDPELCTLHPVAGGDIHQAFRVEPRGGTPFFLKTNPRPLDAIFDKEGRGLEALRSAASTSGLLRIPQVLHCGTRYLVLEWIEPGRTGTQTAEDLGRGLAELHRNHATNYGWDESNWIGTLVQKNDRCPAEDGPAPFFGRLRLLVQAEIGQDRLPRSLVRNLEALVPRLPDLLPGPDKEQPALLHGDLWGGNWMADSAGQPVLFDPAVYYGCREAELAFTRMFGGFSARFYAAYDEAYPLLSDWEGRVDLWNLYPLLVHANLFGGGYVDQAQRVVQRYVPS